MRTIRPEWVHWDEAAGAYDRSFWQRIPPWERTEWGRYLRLRRGTRKQDAVLADVRGRGETIEHKSQYSEWENRKPLPAYWQRVFSDMYGGGPETLPETNGTRRPQHEAATSSADMAALVAELHAQNELLREQTDVNRQLVTMVGQLALVMHRDRDEPPSWFEERGNEWTELVLATIRTALGGSASGGPSESDPPLPGQDQGARKPPTP